MIWGPKRLHELVDPGARFRAEHSAWLTHAMRSRTRYPRIPAKRADQGGFELGRFPAVGSWMARVREQPGHVAMDGSGR